jgi:hypothetical protein
MVASFMKQKYPNLLKYHSFNEFGKTGERIRESNDFLREMEKFLNLDMCEEIPYEKFIKFVNYKYKYNNKEIPSYLQIEHI